jgi:hypothetical protein
LSIPAPPDPRYLTAGEPKDDPDSPVKIRLDYLFPAFTIDEHLGPPKTSYYSSLYHIVILISGNPGGIIRLEHFFLYFRQCL